MDTSGAVVMNAQSLPVNGIPEHAGAVHGLTYEGLMKAGAPRWPAVHKRMLTVMTGVSLALAWNAPLIVGCLNRQGSAMGCTCPEYLAPFCSRTTESCGRIECTRCKMPRATRDLTFPGLHTVR